MVDAQKKWQNLLERKTKFFWQRKGSCTDSNPLHNQSITWKRQFLGNLFQTQSVNQWINRTLNQSICRAINQSIDWTIQCSLESSKKISKKAGVQIFNFNARHLDIDEHQYSDHDDRAQGRFRNELKTLRDGGLSRDHEESGEDTAHGSADTALRVQWGLGEATCDGVTWHKRSENVAQPNRHQFLGWVDGVLKTSAECLGDGDTLNGGDL